MDLLPERPERALRVTSILDTNAAGYDAPRALTETENTRVGRWQKKDAKIRKREKLKSEQSVLSLSSKFLLSNLSSYFEGIYANYKNI